MNNSAIVSTDLFYLRPLTRGDINNGWLKWVNDPNIAQHLTHSAFVDHASLESYLEASQPTSAYMFAICLCDGDQYIGNAKIGSINWIHRNATYGRIIGESTARGKGIGTEVLLALAYFAFFRLNLRRIYTGVSENNVASIASNKKAGAVVEGKLRNHFFTDGKYTDCISFGINREDLNESNWQNRISLV